MVLVLKWWYFLSHCKKILCCLTPLKVWGQVCFLQQHKMTTLTENTKYLLSLLTVFLSSSLAPPGTDMALLRRQSTRHLQQGRWGAFTRQACHSPHIKDVTICSTSVREGPAVREDVPGRCDGSTLSQAHLLLMEAVRSREQSEGVHSQRRQVLELTQLTVQLWQAVLDEVDLLWNLPHHQAHLLCSSGTRIYKYIYKNTVQTCFFHLLIMMLNVYCSYRNLTADRNSKHN